MAKDWIIKSINKRYFLINGKRISNCQIGDGGVKQTSRKIEGDKATPNGKFKLTSIFFRKDRVLRSYFKKKNSLRLNQIKRTCGWCDDINSLFYNKYINTNNFLPKNTNYENFWREDNTYDIIITISHNTKPIIKNKGSAIFIHCSFFDNRNTAGCIALKKKDLVFLLKKYRHGIRLKINL